MGEILLHPTRQIIEVARKSKMPNRWKDPEAVRDQVNFTKALYLARKISTPEYVFLVSLWVEGLNEGRWMDGNYGVELRTITNALKELENRFGLTNGEYWPRGDGPDEYERLRIPLEDQFENELDRQFIQTLRDFGLEDVADIKEHRPKELDRLRERGRRCLNHKSEVIPALKDVIVQYETDAGRAASVGAYSAAVTLLAASLEGVLLLRCLKARSKALRVAQSLAQKSRPFSNDVTKWHFETLIEVCLAAGWLPSVSTEYAEFDSAALAHILRNMRDFLHPGRCARERPWRETGERDFNDAKAIYDALQPKLGGRMTSLRSP